MNHPEAEDANGTLQKWKIKAGKAMFALKTTVEKDVLEHVRDAKIPHEAWSTFAELFSKTNDTRLQLLESELLSYCHKVKLLCQEIFELDPEAQIGETRFENLLAGQEALAKQMEGVSLKGKEEALYAYKGRWNSKQYTVSRTKKNENKAKSNQGERSTHVEGDSKNPDIKKKIEGKCYNCGMKGHVAKDCWSKKGLLQ
ncbi:hypothetical protein CsSME_00014387 [Camellia sinensis var. sinensis]